MWLQAFYAALYLAGNSIRNRRLGRRPAGPDGCLKRVRQMLPFPTPGFPIASQSFAKEGWGLGIETSTDCKRRDAQFPLTLIDHPVEHAELRCIVSTRIQF